MQSRIAGVSLIDDHPHFDGHHIHKGKEHSAFKSTSPMVIKAPANKFVKLMKFDKRNGKVVGVTWTSNQELETMKVNKVSIFKRNLKRGDSVPKHFVPTFKNQSTAKFAVVAQK